MATYNAEKLCRLMNSHNFHKLTDICTEDCVWWEDKLWQLRPATVQEKMRELSNAARANSSMGFELEALVVKPDASDAFLFGRFGLAPDYKPYIVIRLTFDGEGMITGRFLFRPPSAVEAQAALKHPACIDTSDVHKISPDFKQLPPDPARTEAMEDAIRTWVRAWDEGAWELLEQVCEPECPALDGVGIWTGNMPNRERMQKQLKALFPQGVDPNVMSISASEDTNVGFLQWDYIWREPKAGRRGLSDGITVFEFGEGNLIKAVFYFKNAGFVRRSAVFKTAF